MIRILAVDDHPLFRDGISALVSSQADMTIVAEAANGREAVEQFRRHHPDVTLMDLQMPEVNGLDALLAIRNEFPSARVIVLTTYTGDVQVMRAMKAGARAYLLKNALHKDLLDTIRAVHSGRRTLSPEASYELAEHATDDALTPAEVAVLQLIASGNANKQIAEELGVSEETIKGRVRSILSKLGANDRTHAAMIGVRRGIIDSERLERVVLSPFWGFLAHAPLNTLSQGPLTRFLSTCAHGSPGLALLLMRLVGGSVLIAAGSTMLLRSGLTGSAAVATAAVVAGLLLIAGLWTPMAGSLAATVAIWNGVSKPGDSVASVLLATIAVALVLIGPGAYSSDARRSGWKRIDLSDQR